jgi:tRNA(Ile)-lysidine synthase
MTRERQAQARPDAERPARPSGLLERVRADGLLVAGRPVLVLLSGGRDSTCLLDLAVRIAGPANVNALHVNYGLREAADADEAHCRALCQRLGVQLVVERADRLARRPDKGNVQAWARKLRYMAAGEIVAVTGADVATGHTATDQVETILYRLASSPSRRAILGMTSQNGILRPLLSLTREQTTAYCRERGLDWREDESNQSRAYARARIRSHLVPALRDVHPAAEQNLLALAEILREEADVLDDLVGSTLIGREEIGLDELRGLPRPLARLVLQRLADTALGGPAPGTARRAEDILSLGPNAALDLPHGVRAVVERGLLSFERQRRPRAHKLEQ